jgi:hypothetical protein
MDRQAAAHIISDTFDHPFDEARFQHFVLNLLNDLDSSKTFDRYGNFIPDSFKGRIRRYKRLGKYHDPAGNELDVLTVQLVRETALERARTTQRNFVAWYLKNKEKRTRLSLLTTQTIRKTGGFLLYGWSTAMRSRNQV